MLRSRCAIRTSIRIVCNVHRHCRSLNNNFSLLVHIYQFVQSKMSRRRNEEEEKLTAAFKTITGWMAGMKDKVRESKEANARMMAELKEKQQQVSPKRKVMIGFWILIARFLIYLYFFFLNTYV